MEVDLRLILLGVGAVVILAILLDALRRRQKINAQVREFEETVLASKQEVSPGPFSVTDDEADDAISSPRPVEQPLIDTSEAPYIIAITVLPGKNQNFTGRALTAAFQGNQLKFGHRRIYHKHRGDKVEGEVLFSVASLTEPGWFEPSKMVTSQFRGLVMIMNASQLHDPLPCFDKMLAVARNLANALGGTLCDDSRHHLSPQIIEHIKEKIRETQRRQLAREKSLDN